MHARYWTEECAWLYGIKSLIAPLRRVLTTHISFQRRQVYYRGYDLIKVILPDTIKKTARSALCSDRMMKRHDRKRIAVLRVIRTDTHTHTHTCVISGLHQTRLPLPDSFGVVHPIYTVAEPLG